MQDEQQFEQLMLQYRQLKNGSEDISRMIDNEDFDSAITMIKNREQLFLSCKCMRKYLELTPVEQKQADEILDEIRALELQNIKKLEKGMTEITLEGVTGDEITWTEDGEPNKAPKAVEIKDGAYAAME